VLIGTEANLHPVEDISLIATRYDAGQHAHGTLSVVGPTRMDYAQVVPLVRYTASFVSERLSGGPRDAGDAEGDAEERDRTAARSEEGAEHAERAERAEHAGREGDPRG